MVIEDDSTTPNDPKSDRPPDQRVQPLTLPCAVLTLTEKGDQGENGEQNHHANAPTNAPRIEVIIVENISQT